MFCPKCRLKVLKEGTVKGDSGVVIDYCPACKGFWLNAGEFEKLSAHAVRKLKISRDAEKSEQMCPQCETALYSFEYPQTLVTIEMCKHCKGIWIDAGELKEIETVRRFPQKHSQTEEYDDVTGIKGWLIGFIDDAIGYLESV